MSADRGDWHWEDVKARVRMRGTTLEQLAVRLGYSKAAVAVVGKKPWPSVQAGIAQFLSLRPEEIWPSRYDADGVPIRQRNRPLTSKARRVPAPKKPQKQEAA